ncbi:uncharacterized protein LOC131688044 [Topomyia yanbarensis]|uniref:uncharacterized protein LOC131688044 n=1 Tax=Topomyia yanbarensis TaxID=2498891 RepID=UPI00273A8B1D|nr:uncharacterized protein LOC131688044 [Topomyia yanbarensis]
MNCKKCTTLVVPGDNIIDCDGFCSECVALTVAEVLSCNKHRNIFWMCTPCADIMSDVRNFGAFRDKRQAISDADCFVPIRAASVAVHTKSQTDEDNSNYLEEISKLKQQIADIQESVAEICRFRPDATSALENSPDLSSSMSSTKLLQGTSIVSRFTHSSTKKNSVSSRCWLFFIRIKNTVSENEVTAMVAEALGSEDIIVKRLVPEWKDVASMPFISFKVGVDSKLKRIALAPTTWPHGICFREFHEQFSVWSP